MYGYQAVQVQLRGRFHPFGPGRDTLQLALTLKDYFDLIRNKVLEVQFEESLLRFAAALTFTLQETFLQSFQCEPRKHQCDHGTAWSTRISS